MRPVPGKLAAELRDALGLRRAVETGTFRGDGARTLATLFGEVVTIELSEQLSAEASVALADEPTVRVLHGNSADLLDDLVDSGKPTFFWLDGHWSGGETVGSEAQCPVLAELAAISVGHPDDCVLIDDARFFAASPPAPFDPSQWPTLTNLLDTVRDGWPAHHVTLVKDVVVAVPSRAKSLVDAFGHREDERTEHGTDANVARQGKARQREAETQLRKVERQLGTTRRRLVKRRRQRRRAERRLRRTERRLVAITRSAWWRAGQALARVRRVGHGAGSLMRHTARRAATTKRKLVAPTFRFNGERLRYFYHVYNAYRHQRADRGDPHLSQPAPEGRGLSTRDR